MFSVVGIPVMKIGFSLLEILHRENPVFITGPSRDGFAVRILHINNILFLLELELSLITIIEIK